MIIRRFTLTQRVFHAMLAFSFMMQSLTGMVRLYADSLWGQRLSALFGGQAGVLWVHKLGGVIMVAIFVAHLTHLALTCSARDLTGPSSMLPRVSDFTNFIQHVRWMLTGNGHPRLDRFAYWEKFDYWAVFWGVAIIGGSGLLLIDPVASARYVPGWWLNIALALHRDEALLAMGYIFLIHFTVAHMRRSRFPMDMAMVDGGMSLEEVRRERPAWQAQLMPQEASRVGELPAGVRRAALVAGLAVVLCGWLLALWAVAEVARRGL